MTKKRAMLLALIVTIVIVAWSLRYWLMERAREAEAHSNPIALWAAADFYSSDDPFISYPLDFETLIQSPQLKSMPKNPYTGDPVKHVPIQGAGSPGDVSYVVKREELLPGYEVASRFCLVTYSRRRLFKRAGYKKWGYWVMPPQWVGTGQLDWNHVLLYLENADGKPSDDYLRRKRRDEFLHPPANQELELVP